MTVEHVLRIATIYSSYTSIFLPFPLLHITPSFSTSYATFDDIRVFWWQKQDALEVCEASVSEEGGWDSRVVFIPFIAFLSFSVAVSASGKVRRMQGKRVSPAKENPHWNRKQTVLNPVRQKDQL